MLCYLFDNNELTNAELKNIKEESAQYSLHVVGLVINSLNKTVIIAGNSKAVGSKKKGRNTLTEIEESIERLENLSWT